MALCSSLIKKPELSKRGRERYLGSTNRECQGRPVLLETYCSGSPRVGKDEEEVVECWSTDATELMK
jgi:hypothetical protein